MKAIYAKAKRASQAFCLTCPFFMYAVGQELLGGISCRFFTETRSFGFG